MGDLLIRGARLVRLDGATPSHPVDVVARDGRIAGIEPSGGAARHHPYVVEADGRWLSPGLWDQHVHFSQWALASLRLGTSGTRTPEELTHLVATHVAGLPDDGSLVVGLGHRPASWTRPVTTAELDAVSGGHPVALVSGDVHSAWVSSTAQRLLGISAEGVCAETEWFAAANRLEELQSDPSVLGPALERRVREAAALGLVGLVDLVMDGSLGPWAALSAAGLPLPRVRVGVFPHGLDAVVAAGLRTGDPLDERGLVTMGPLKVITDGSLGSVTACCREPYGPNGTHGVLAYGPEQLRELLTTAHRHGLSVACHAIGDAAAEVVLDAMESVGARGSMEHAQLLTAGDVRRLARLGIAASVQPWHLVDDVPALDRLWPDRAADAFPFRSLLDAGVELRLGSDAPVAPLDPFAAVAAAVHRNGVDLPSWHPEQRLTVREAWAASVDGRRVAMGEPADLVLLDSDPLADAGDSAQVARHVLGLRPVHATVVAGEVTHLAG